MTREDTEGGDYRGILLWVSLQSVFVLLAPLALTKSTTDDNTKMSLLHGKACQEACPLAKEQRISLSFLFFSQPFLLILTTR